MKAHLMHTETDQRDSALEAAILELLKVRKPGASICPSEAASSVFGNGWREQMLEVRKVANKMAWQNQIEICQKGTVVDPVSAKGPIRLRMHREQSE